MKAQMDVLKAELKTTQGKIDKLVTNIVKKSEKVHEKLWAIANHNEGNMEFYDVNGIFIHQRPLLPSEKQLRLTHSKTQTN